MTDRVGDEIARAFAEILAEKEREAQQVKRAEALRILRTIPSGTPDSDLTPEQRQAWRDYNESP